MAEILEKKLTLTSVDELPNAADHEKVRQKSPRMERLRIHFRAEVSTDHADILLLACCLISGFVDSTLYNGTPVTNPISWCKKANCESAYNTFVSMQTGRLSRLRVLLHAP